MSDKSKTEKSPADGPKARLKVIAAEVLKKAQRTVLPDTLVVLGSGFKEFAQTLKDTTTLDLQELPGFPVPAVTGHGNQLIIGRSGKKEVVVLTGRVHLYEGYLPDDIVYALRVLHFAGVRRTLLTNASGSVDGTVRPGTVLLISDQINLTGQNCLIGNRELGAEFVDMSAVYDQAWRKKIKKAATAVRPGVYAGLTGPAFETPAEAKYLKKIGANVVGMSTVLEAMAARQLGMQVAGLSFVTNWSGGMGKELDHLEVLAMAKKHGPKLVKILAAAVNV